MPEVVANAQYNLAKPKSLTMKVVESARRKMFDAFLRETAIQPHETLVDIGVTSDRSYESSNYVEAWYPHKDKITAVGIDNADFLETLYPGMRYVNADGRNLPFEDKAFDVAHSSAVLEHVGSVEQQLQFIRELSRVTRRAIFFTTPDRAFPIEVHSLLPGLHWLPKKTFRGIISKFGYGFFAKEENLNLLWAHEVRRMVEQVAPGQGKVWALRTFGWPSNVLAIIRKNGEECCHCAHGSNAT